MAQSRNLASLWWPEERIRATLDPNFIFSRLRPENLPRLSDLPRWAEDLTSETYMERILLKAGRLFLILDDIGIPDRIFALLDESRDDDDLPIAEPNVDTLCLSPDGDDPALDARFFRAQWRFLVRGIAEGDHVTYTEKEGVPVEMVSSAVQGRDESVDKVILAGSVCRVLLRTQVQVNEAPHFFSADEILAEIKSLRRLAHQHVVSIYASYFVDDCVCALFTGVEADRTLHSFLADESPAFKRLAKQQRRQTLITWPHCLAAALSWLHARGHAHAAIRPSNILIDANFHIYLGQFQALDALLARPRVNDLEAYQYSAPEHWARATPASAPPTAPSRTILPSGGRTARRKKPQPQFTPLDENLPTSPETSRPDSAASNDTVVRAGLPGSPSRLSFAISTSTSSSSAPSSAHSETPNPSQKASDIFSLAATTLTILTHLVKRTQKSFTTHRSARNRTAGRGGSIPDASFHLPRNAAQIHSWIALLEHDARKRARRGRPGDRVFCAVPRMLGLVRDMLVVEPVGRPCAWRVRKGFAKAVIEGEGGFLHCREEEEEEGEGEEGDMDVSLLEVLGGL